MSDRSDTTKTDRGGKRRAAPDKASPSYEASPIKRRRATQAEMADRREMIVDLVHEHGPCSVRHVYYRAVVARVPGITKTNSGYAKVQRLVLDLRRSGSIRYFMIVDSTRWMRKPTTWNSLDEALRSTAQTYRRDLWRRSDYRVEVWCESDSIASTVYEITEAWDVPLMVCRGFSSETFAYNAAFDWNQEPYRQPVVLYVGDHDPAGLNIEAKLRETLSGFAHAEPEWVRLGVTWDQVVELDLPGTPPKKPYGYPEAVEAEALPPHLLREIVDDAIAEYADVRELAVLRAAEESEREILLAIAERNVG
jgi:hypothetical protein